MMDKKSFDKRLAALTAEHDAVIGKKNEVDGLGNGWYDRYKNPVLTAQHLTPVVMWPKLPLTGY